MMYQQLLFLLYAKDNADYFLDCNARIKGKEHCVCLRASWSPFVDKRRMTTTKAAAESLWRINFKGVSNILQDNQIFQRQQTESNILVKAEKCKDLIHKHLLGFAARMLTMVTSLWVLSPLIKSPLFASTQINAVSDSAVNLLTLFCLHLPLFPTSGNLQSALGWTLSKEHLGSV